MRKSIQGDYLLLVGWLDNGVQGRSGVETCTAGKRASLCAGGGGGGGRTLCGGGQLQVVPGGGGFFTEDAGGLVWIGGESKAFWL